MLYKYECVRNIDSENIKPEDFNTYGFGFRISRFLYLLTDSHKFLFTDFQIKNDLICWLSGHHALTKQNHFSELPNGNFKLLGSKEGLGIYRIWCPECIDHVSD